MTAFPQVLLHRSGSYRSQLMHSVHINPSTTCSPALPVRYLGKGEYTEARKQILDSVNPEKEQEKPILGRLMRISQPLM